MNGDDDCTKWHDLEADASAEAAGYLPTPAGWAEIREAVAKARNELGGEDVRRHRVQFDPESWNLDAKALPEQVLGIGHVSRSHGFNVASEPATASTNWKTFCTSFVFGYGPYGIGPCTGRKPGC